MLGYWHQAEMAFAPGQRVVVIQDAKHRNAQWFQGFPEQGRVADSADTVQDDPGHIHPAVQIPVAVHHCGDGTTHGRGIDHEDDRGLQEAGDRSRGPVATGLSGPIEQTHHTFDDQEVGSLGPGSRKRDEVLLPGQPRVQGAPRAPRGE